MLEKLFTSKNRIKIMGFLFFKNPQTYIREMSRELKISPSAVKNEVDNLLEVGLITKQKNRIELDKKSNILEDLKNVFIKTDYLTYPIKKAVNNIKKIQFALIFGSFARENYSYESDIDLMVIGEITSFEFYQKIKPIEDEIKREINPVVWTLENLKKQRDSGFIKEIFAGKVTMIKGDENELRKIIR